MKYFIFEPMGPTKTFIENKVEAMYNILVFKNIK